MTNPDGGDPDVITYLAGRARAMSEYEFEIEWWSLTTDEQVEFMALMKQRTAHGREKLEALEEENRILKLLLCLEGGAITPLEFVRRVCGAVPE